ncbi:hypothetical protein OH77DRAFT_1525816 [Trametes cingulata]|nr:hypothetical protein OH77DRAFT_1525816 [Trametes cingulata]
MLVQASVVQKVPAKREDGEAEEQSDAEDFYEEEEQLEEGQEKRHKKRKYRKDVEEALREWIETEGCRRAVADAYFDNPPRGTACPPTLCCDNCAMRAPSSSPLVASATPSADALAGTSLLPLQDRPHANCDTDSQPQVNDAQGNDIPDDEKDDDDDTGDGHDAASGYVTPAEASGSKHTRPRLSPKRRKDEHLKRVKAELRTWRIQTRRSKYAGTSLKAENILPDRALQTIASLRRGIKTIDDLRPHLKPSWPFLEVLGDEVLKLVKKLDEEDDSRRMLRNIQAREEKKRETERRKAVAAAEKAIKREAERQQQRWAQTVATYSGPLGSSSALNAPSVTTPDTAESAPQNRSMPSCISLSSL